MRISGKWSRRLLLGTLVIALGSGIGWGVIHLIPRGPGALGRAAYERGDWSEASDLATRRLKDSPDDRDALRLLARSNARLGRDESAQRIFLRLGANTWQAEDYVLLALGLRRRGRTDLALASLLNARKDDPSDPEALGQLAEISLESGRPIEAAGFARLLAAGTRRHPGGDLILARALEELGDPSAAAEVLERELRRPTAEGDADGRAAGLRKRLAKDLLRLGRADEAHGHLDRLGAAGNGSEVAWLLSRAHLQRGEADAAARSLATAGDYGADGTLRDEPAPYVGAARCAECHATIYRDEQGSRHARTLASGVVPVEESIPEFSIQDPVRPNVRHTLKRAGGRRRFETTIDGKTYGAAIDHALGSGHRGVTFVGTDDEGRLCELRLSLYANGSKWDLTTGQVAEPATAKEWLGRTIGADEQRRCLSCHTTRTIRTGEITSPDPVDRAIGCERCHGPGGNHVRAVALGFPDLAIAGYGAATNVQIGKLCGDCHGQQALESKPDGPADVRFQAIALSKSRCFTEGGGGMSCLTCHDPHRDAETKASFYEAKCLECHDAGRSQSDPKRRPVCPVDAKANCLNCHMPRVNGIVPYTEFTNHRILVNKPQAGR